MSSRSRYNAALKEIEEGIAGRNAGLNMGFNRLMYYVPGLQRRTFYVVGGETGTGKSSFGLNCLVYEPYDHWKSGTTQTKNLKIFYWSLEMHPNVILTKAICRKIYLDHGILVDVNYVLSRGKNRISKEIYELVLRYAEYFADFEDHVHFIEGDNPTGIYLNMERYMGSIGEILKRKVEVKNANGEIIKVDTFDSYTPREDIHVVCVVDHVALMKKERGFAKKANIDVMTDYAIELRNRYGITIVFIQQLNRDISSVDRLKLDRLEPMLSDFKETSDTTDAADFVMALFNPKKYEILKYKGYDTKRLQDRFRYLKLLKSRDGISDIGVGLEYVGEVGIFRELPKSADMTDIDYSKIMLTQKSF